MTLVKEMKWKTKLLIILACIAGILATFVFQIAPSVLGFIGLFVLGFILGPYVPRRGGGGWRGRRRRGWRRRRWVRKGTHERRTLV